MSARMDASAAGVVATDAARRVRRSRRQRNRLGYIGAAVVGLTCLFALLGPFLIPHDPNEQNLTATGLLPWSEVDGRFHFLGTDPLGRDTFARLAAGAQASITVVLAALFIGGGIGIAIGITAGSRGGWVDNVLMRFADAQLALPTTIFAMIVGAVLGVGFGNTVLAIGLASWPVIARVIRAEVISLKQKEFFLVAQIMGVSRWRMARVHILPNVLGAVAVVGTLELGGMIIVESTLSFIGLGMQPPNASLGSMIRQGQQYIYTDWWLAAFPGLIIVFFVLGMNLMGDWLRDALDPRRRH